MKKFIIKDLEDGFYYGGDYGWCDRADMAETFESKIEAERFMMDSFCGLFKIEEIYKVKI